MGKTTLLTTLIVITSFASIGQAVHVELFVGRSCKPDQPEIIIRGSEVEEMTSIVFTDPAGSTIGQAYLTHTDPWEPKEAYKSRTYFDVVNVTERLYKFRLEEFKFEDNGEYRVDVKHGGVGSTLVKVSIRKVDESSLEAKLYHDDRCVRDGDSLNLTSHPQLVLQTGGSLRANVSINVDQYHKFCSNTTQCTTDIGQGLEPGSHWINVSHKVRYVEQCVRVSTDHAETVTTLTLYVTLASLPVTLRNKSDVGVISGWKISTIILIVLVPCGIITVIVRRFITKKNEERVPAESSSDPEVNSGGGLSRKPPVLSGSSTELQVPNDPNAGQHQSGAGLNHDGGFYHAPSVAAGNSSEFHMKREKIAGKKENVLTDEGDETYALEASAQTGSSSEGDDEGKRNSIEHDESACELGQSNESASIEVVTGSHDEERDSEQVDQEEADDDEEADIDPHEVSDAPLLPG